MTTNRIWAIGFIVQVLALVSLAVYTRGVDQAWRECIPPVVKQNTESNQAARDAANRRDRADIRRLEAWERVIEEDAPQSEYLKASKAYKAQIRRAIRIRAANPIPDFDKLCHAND